MLFNKIGNNTKVLEKALDAAWLKNEAISNNIANVNTPGYKKSYVRFEEQLAGAASEFQTGSLKKNKNFLPIGNDTRDIPAPEVLQDTFTSARQDGNNVDIDVEMAELAKNTIKYNALITQISKQFGNIKMVISEGRR
ncbi:MAG: flagellar basal-body rod protein FlgB [Clostridia bacterium]|jgi:flagellar basal-body rod protein FlgB|nr:flagellar basal-body rod protein FlgB [Clostridia bacterium]